jgi:outer membrane lipoprotein carrier protein
MQKQRFFNRQMFGGIVLSVGALVGFEARADAMLSLAQFLEQSQSGRAQFTQTVTAPTRAGQPTAKPKVSSGQFEFLRPNQFRFEYQKPFEQIIVADGKTLWLYDVDLNQVSSRPQAQALGSTPAGLIATTASVNRLAEAFDLVPQADAKGLSWIQATPKVSDGQIKRMRIGFAKVQLSIVEIEDAFGQTSTLQFHDFKTALGFKPQHFAFKPPAGTEVVQP